MDESRDMTFSELKEKDVVTVEGNNLGKPVDLVFSLQSQKVRGIVTPYGKRCLFFHSQELYIPYSRIKKNRRRRYNRGRCALQTKGSIGQRSFLR